MTTEERPASREEAAIERLRVYLIKTSPAMHGGRLMDYDGVTDPGAIKALRTELIAAYEAGRASMPCYRDVVEVESWGDCTTNLVFDFAPQSSTPYCLVGTASDPLCPSCKARAGEQR